MLIYGTLVASSAFSVCCVRLARKFYVEYLLGFFIKTRHVHSCNVKSRRMLPYKINYYGSTYHTDHDPLKLKFSYSVVVVHVLRV
jgi:hypothetical protein